MSQGHLLLSLHGFRFTDPLKLSSWSELERAEEEEEGISGRRKEEIQVQSSIPIDFSAEEQQEEEKEKRKSLLDASEGRAEN